MNSETLIAMLLAMPTSAHAAVVQAGPSSIALFAVCIGATLFVIGRKALRGR